MRNERRAILALMAAGRITASEAERLLRAWNERFEGLWIAVLCLLICMAQLAGSGGGWGHWVHGLHGLVRQGINTCSAAAGLLHKGMGGTI